ncbi:MAG: hypothetical protein U0936_26730 [Planctomycetaceae bacterium]
MMPKAAPPNSLRINQSVVLYLYLLLPIAGKFSVTIRKPSGPPPRVVTTLKDAHGSSVTVACSTCHTTRPPNHQNKTVKTLDEFHSGMAFSHGTA